MSGSGSEDAYGGDVIDSTTITGTGAVGADTTKPELDASLVSLHGPAGAVFPWDALVLRHSEGLDETALGSALSVEAGPTGGPPAPPGLALQKTFEPSATSPTGWGGAMQTTLRLSSWDLTSGLLGLAAAPGLADPTGNVTAAFSTTVPLIGVTQASTHGLDSDVVSVATWGAVTLLGGKSGSDPACEQGGCAKIGPMKLGFCSNDRAGLAGRITTAGKTEVSVRYRVWAKSASVSMPALGVDLFAHDGTVQSVESPNSLALSSVSSPLDGFGFASAWATLTIPTKSADEVGFVVYADAKAACGFTPPGYDAILLIDRVEAK